MLSGLSSQTPSSQEQEIARPLRHAIRVWVFASLPVALQFLVFRPNPKMLPTTKEVHMQTRQK